MTTSPQFLFTSESVCAGHPDKVADACSDAILDHLLARDPHPEHVRCAIETLVTRDRTVIAGEYSASTPLTVDEIRAIARDTIASLGYTDETLGFSSRSPIDVHVQAQSVDIAAMVDEGGAGDQGLMFGFAVDQTPELMPLPLVAAHQLARAVDHVRTSGTIGALRPDGKTQVTVRFDEDRRPIAIEKIVLAAPHHPDVAKREVRALLWQHVIVPCAQRWNVPLASDRDDERFFVFNGTGDWHIGGPASDTGLTGRKIIVDTYGGYGRHGGGAFSGKDASKVDRSAAYFCRLVAKSVVAAGLARSCEIQVAYAIGHREPLSIHADTRGTGVVPDAGLTRLVAAQFDFAPGAITRHLGLTQPVFRATSAYGHFGREEFAWEQPTAIVVEDGAHV